MKNGYLFTISGDGSVIGGHMLSSISLASAMQREGNKVGILLAPFKVGIPDLTQASCKIISSPLPKNYLIACIKRSFDVYKAIKLEGYSVLIASDYTSVISAFPSMLITGIPLIQIHANEKVTFFRPVCLPGIIVFSNSVFNGYNKQYKIPKEFMVISSGRVDFNYFSNNFEGIRKKIIFNKFGKKILIISRLVEKKIPTLKNIFDQLCEIGNRDVVQLVIIGDGEARDKLEKMREKILSHLHTNSSINFVGAFRVTPDIIKQADVVVGQGRTVIEAIASGIPSIVSGEEGYKGLVTPEKFLDFRSTDFSGRMINCETNLQIDLKNLAFYRTNIFPFVFKMTKDYYDTSIGIQALKNISESILQIYPNPILRRFNYFIVYSHHFILRFWYYVKKISKKIINLFI